LQRDAEDAGVPIAHACEGCLREVRVVPVALAHVAETMAM
jgi:hypothetical protein